MKYYSDSNLPLSTVTMLRNFFTRKPVPLTGAPAVRRLKSYSAQSGYVYQYFYEGQRPFRSGGESGVEFVFTLSADRKSIASRERAGSRRRAPRVGRGAPTPTVFH